VEFYCYPKSKGIYLLYSSRSILKNQLFNCLSIQCSPKDSIYYRILKSPVGYLFSTFFKKNVDVPFLGFDYIGLVKYETVIFFQLDRGEVVNVWREKEGEWQKEPFIGYQIIHEYTLTEFNLKFGLIKDVLKRHWESVNKDSFTIHGDLTHFNVLINGEGEECLIDAKDSNHSKLFDFFYFYSYLKQSVERCQGISKVDKLEIIKRLGVVLLEVCNYKTSKEFELDIESMKIPLVNGLINKEVAISNFVAIFKKGF